MMASELPPILDSNSLIVCLKSHDFRSKSKFEFLQSYLFLLENQKQKSYNLLKNHFLVLTIIHLFLFLKNRILEAPNSIRLKVSISLGTRSLWFYIIFFSFVFFYFNFWLFGFSRINQLRKLEGAMLEDNQFLIFCFSFFLWIVFLISFEVN